MVTGVDAALPIRLITAAVRAFLRSDGDQEPSEQAIWSASLWPVSMDPFAWLTVRLCHMSYYIASIRTRHKLADTYRYAWRCYHNATRELPF